MFRQAVDPRVLPKCFCGVGHAPNVNVDFYFTINLVDDVPVFFSQLTKALLRKIYSFIRFSCNTFNRSEHIVNAKCLYSRVSWN